MSAHATGLEDNACKNDGGRIDETTFRGITVEGLYAPHKL